MLNNLVIINQFLAFVAAAAISYYSFRALNCCDKDTMWYIRVPLILLFPGSLGVSIYVVSGHAPHWSVTMTVIAIAMKLAGERRRLVGANTTKRVKHS